MTMTMIDGKVFNAVIGTKSTYVTQRPLSIDEISLRIWVVTSSCVDLMLLVVHLNNFPRHTDMTIEDQEVKQKRKLLIQEGFKKEVGLLINMPKQGFGGTNDGNKA